MVKVAWGGVKDEPTCICIRTILILKADFRKRLVCSSGSTAEDPR